MWVGIRSWIKASSRGLGAGAQGAAWGNQKPVLITVGIRRLAGQLKVSD